LVGVEGTGSYGAGLTRHLLSRQVAVVEIDRPNRQLTTSTVAGGGPAWAKATTGTGTYLCSHETGSVQFSPPFADTGTGKVKATVDISLSACSGGAPSVSSAQLTGHLKFANGGSTCSSETQVNILGKLHLGYTNGAKKSGFTVGSGSVVAIDPNNDEGELELSGTTTGSYPTTDGFEDVTGDTSGNCTTGVQAISVAGNFASL
jgi:hypothetical protein